MFFIQVIRLLHVFVWLACDNLNTPTSIFSSSFFWSISVIRLWISEADGRTLSEAASSFLMHDWQEQGKKQTKSPHATVSNTKQFSLETWPGWLVKNYRGTGSFEERPHTQEPNYPITGLQLTFSLSVLLLSVSDSAPEEDGLWLPATLAIHGGRTPCCHWLLWLSMLCWGISGRLRQGEVGTEGRCTTLQGGFGEYCSNITHCTAEGSSERLGDSSQLNSDT